MDYSVPGFSVDGMSQATILEWVAIYFYKILIRTYYMAQGTLLNREENLKRVDVCIIDPFCCRAESNTL